jgi:hypothetical protein
MRHVVEYVALPKDPGARREAFAYCGAHEECSGSGRHGMLLAPKDECCPICKKLWDARIMLDNYLEED